MACKFLKLFRYRGKDVVRMRSENGKIENFQGFTRFVAKFLKIWPKFWKPNLTLEFGRNLTALRENRFDTFVAKTSVSKTTIGFLGYQLTLPFYAFLVVRIY